MVSQAKVMWIGLTPRQEEGGLVRLGGRSYGNTYLGALHYRNAEGKPGLREVAIKVFRNPLTEQMAERYRETIRSLSKEGLPLKGVFMYRLRNEDLKNFFDREQNVLGLREGQWVQVTPFLGTPAGSFFYNPKGREDPHSEETRREAIRLMTKAGNTGHAPPSDFVIIEKGARLGKKRLVRPWDLDVIVRVGKQPPDFVAGEIAERIRELYSDANERDALWRTALTHAQGGLREALEKLAPKKR